MTLINKTFNHLNEKQQKKKIFFYFNFLGKYDIMKN
jgi:hypothetical protein